MRVGLVIGKFMPLHKGHLELIDFACQHCDRLDIILCYTDNEPIAGAIRKKWLEESLSKNSKASIIFFRYNDNALPNTSVSSMDVSEKWAAELKKLSPQASIVFSSEDYGDYVAGFMNIEHIAFNKSRTIVPVSASVIRNDPFNYWEFLPKTVRSFFTKKIVLLGSESTGKSTLTEKLAGHYQTAYVPEVARDIIEKTKECTVADLDKIATAHAEKINSVLAAGNKLLFIDTDITITKSYSRYLFGRELHVEPWIEEANQADLYLFLEPDCPFVQDGTRLDEVERNTLSIRHKEELGRNGIKYISLPGSWEDRFLSARAIIDILWPNKKEGQ